MRFIDEHKDRDHGGRRWGVEPICAVLTENGCAIAPSIYCDARTREPSRRELRDEQLKPLIERVHEDNFGVYGPRKVWLALNREGVEVARCTVERLMRELGLQGARRGKKYRTTTADPAAARPRDLVNRHFGVLAPDRLWVADFTYVATWAGMVHVATVYASRPSQWTASRDADDVIPLPTVLSQDASWVRGLRSG